MSVVPLGGNICTLSNKTSDWKKTHPGERILSCAECIIFFCTSHKYSAANSSSYKTKTYMISLSAKHSCCHLNSPQSETLPNQQFFFIVAADKVSWKQNHTPELINADLKVPFQGDDLPGRNSSSLVYLRQLVLC